MPLQAAHNRPLTTERLREQLGRLGGTRHELGHLDNRLEGDVILPVSELNRLRRELVARVGAAKSEERSMAGKPPHLNPLPRRGEEAGSGRRTLASPPEGEAGALSSARRVRGDLRTTPTFPALSVLCRTTDQ